MSAKSLFGAVVRVLGLVILLRGLGGLLNGLIGTALSEFPGAGGYYLVHLVQLLGGILLLRAAPMVIRFAYATGDERE